MSLAVAGPILLVILFGLLLSGLEVAFALGLAGIVAFLFLGGGIQSLAGIPLLSWGTLYSFDLAAVPLFVLMGELFLHSGFSSTFFKAFVNWFGRIPGALCYAIIGASALFSAIVGSSSVCAATVGTVAVPEAEKYKYDRKLVFGTIVSGGALGPVIPPSIVMIIYGLITEQSIAKFFMAAAIPGILLAIVFATYVFFVTKRNPELAPSLPSVTWKEKATTSLGVLPVIVIMVLIVGGIFGGFFTPTESAAIGLLATFVWMLSRGKLRYGVLKPSLKATTHTVGFLFMIVVGATILANAVTHMGVPQAVVGWLGTMDMSPWLIFAVICVIYLFLGMFLEAISIILITLPILYPVVLHLGFDPVWFGVQLLLLIEIGMLTPPVGINLYIVQGISGRPMSEVIMGSVRFIPLWLGMIVIVALFPQIALWLPSVLFGK